MLPIFRKLVFNTWFLAGIPAVIAYLFLHPSSFRYRMTVEDNYLPGYQDIYYDLNGDSISEIFRIGKGVPFYNILVMDNNNKVYEQWNLKDYIDNDLGKIFFDDYDGDRSKEIYIFTYRADSLFLNVNEFFQPSGTLINGKFITKICSIDGKITSIVHPAGFYDLDHDGIKELFFSIYTGFGLVPRKVYIYNFVKQSLKSSELAGVVCQYPHLEDVDSDGEPEIFGDISASGNYNVPVPFTDYSSWFMVYGSDLSFKFPPVEFPGFTNYLQTKFVKNDDFNGFVLLNASGSVNSAARPGIMTYTTDGKQIKSRSFAELGFHDSWVRLQLIDGRIFISGSRLIELDTNLEIINSVRSPLETASEFYTEDIDHDGHNEILLQSSAEKKLVVLNTSLKELSEINLDFKNTVVTFSHFDTADQHKLFISSPAVMYILGFSKNKYYYATYLAYPGIYLFFALFIFLVKKLQTIQIVEKEALKQRLLSLQLKSIKAQLEPHFTFNTLNSVASLIYLKEHQQAYDYLIKFTALLRNMLNDAEVVRRPLDDEILFVRTYLELEKLRFGDKFSYFIYCSEEVRGNEQVPKLVLFTFAENAIKHGLIPKDEAGILKIKIDREKDELKISVEDNGIGRKKSEGQSTSTKKGLKLTTEFYEILSSMNQGKVQYNITDLYSPEGLASGTKVNVFIELNNSSI